MTLESICQKLPDDVQRLAGEGMTFGYMPSVYEHRSCEFMTGSADVFHSYCAFCMHGPLVVHVCCLCVEDLTNSVGVWIICKISDSRRGIRAGGHLISLFFGQEDH